MITAGAAEAVPGIDSVSISTTGKDGRIETVAPTDELAVRADELHYELGEGQCLVVVFDTPDRRGRRHRHRSALGNYGPRAAKEFGIGS